MAREPDIELRSAELLEAAAAAGWRGSDPYDGLWWRWPAPLTAGRRRRQVVMQLHARSPIDVRRLYRGQQRPPIPKALGIFGSTGLRLRRLTGEERYAELARGALAELDADRSAGAGWGYHWDMQTRWSFYPGGSPNVVVTFFAARALAEAERELGAGDYGERARAAARWTLATLHLPERGIFAYHPGSEVLIHNASLLGARIVHTLLPGEGADAVRAAVERTLAGQAADGSWPYGEDIAFVDSFHTGYVLDCLCALRDADPAAVDDALARGSAYYAERFFTAEGDTPLWPGRRFPLDAHSAGTGLSTLATLVRHGHADRELLERVARRTAAEVVRSGHAVHRRWRRGRSTVRFVRWCDAHVALGLADAAATLAGGAADAYARDETAGR